MKSGYLVFGNGITAVSCLVVASIVMTGITGCTAKGAMPVKNISDAEAAIRMAREISDSGNTSLDIRIAEDKLQKAREAAKREDFITSQRLSDEAALDAKVAEIKSQTRKLERMEKDLRESIETLQGEINRNQQRY